MFEAGLAAQPEAREQLAGLLADGGEEYTKAEAHYRDAEEGSDKKCGNCAHYSDHACEIVSGTINPNKTCDHFAANTGDGGHAAKS